MWVVICEHRQFKSFYSNVAKQVARVLLPVLAKLCLLCTCDFISLSYKHKM